ncbi:MAG: crossover junction endodeoxyribonuclease RuvC, partial [Neisseriaceae bacterium]|nr:crossover junction endodeoxyribonuclease RuvC [Neisseriaceae bacterium]
MRIIGIDPGSRITGFGIIDTSERDVQYIASGCIKTTPRASLPERIHTIVHDIFEIIETYRPTVAAVEQVFVNINQSSTLI